jgi:UDP-N-acetylmuramate--alanine ligase
VIASGAHKLNNVEVQTAQEKGIKIITQGEAVGLFMQGKLFDKQFTGISIAGTHGKTTTSAIVATVLKDAGLDPSYVIGTGDVGSLGQPGHFGKGRYFVAEADEYMTDPHGDKTIKFLWQRPQIAVMTNIEYDHPDVYDSLDDVHTAFLQFANQLPEKGPLIVCGDDPEIQRLLKDWIPGSRPGMTNGRAITYGFSPANDYVITRSSISGEHTFFWVSSHGTVLGEFAIRASGDHNALNGLAAVIVALELGIPVEKIKKGLLSFRGSKRRLEFIGDLATGAKAYDDYAHHPTEIKTTLQALRKQYEKKKLVCIFQPHTYSRTKMLFNDFLKAFAVVDSVIITDIYASAREQADETVSSKKLSDMLKQYHNDVLYLPTLSDVVKYIHEKRFRADTVIVTMGAGDIYKIHSELKFI